MVSRKPKTDRSPQERRLIASIDEAARSTAKLKTDLDAASDQWLKLKERALSARKLDGATWTIWAYCREHRDSLDSERHTKMIRKLLDAAVRRVELRLEELLAENAKLTREVADLRRQLRSAASDRLTAEQKLDKILAKNGDAA